MDSALVESSFSLFITMFVIVSVFGGIAVAGSLIERLINENERLEAENRKLRKEKMV
ncbi:hypothetical protein V7183_15040 [Bacillus sp. JJ1127]|uniref:hypothetical protein n=1 Tax=Bacillus sp. JJ1127 TaxID=3122952 RepID=UPI002FFEA474